MRLDILTLFPNMMSMFFEESILKRAQNKGIVEVVFHDLHDYSLTRYGSVDDYPCGGGAGMVMAVEPLANCIEGLKAQRTYDEIIYTAPDGEMLTQPMANTLSLQQNLMILCGHYKGVDERIREHFITAPPEYTRPPEFRGWRVPDILLSGNHAKIEQWRYEQALQRTQERRPDLLKAISEK